MSYSIFKPAGGDMMMIGIVGEEVEFAFNSGCGRGSDATPHLSDLG